MPFASATVVMVRLLVTTIESGCVAVFEAVSVTSTVKLDVPAVSGMPEIVPVEAPRVRPVDSDPVESDHVNGAVPPADASV